MWVHLTGELSPVPKIIVYEYQKTRHSDHPKEYYKHFKGVLMTDGLEQYHKLAREQEGIINANCLAHARRHYANAIKAMGKSKCCYIQHHRNIPCKQSERVLLYRVFADGDSAADR